MDQWRHAHLDPLFPWTLLVGTVWIRRVIPPPRRRSDLLSRSYFRFAVTGLSLVSRISQHMPNRLSPPATSHATARGNRSLIQPPSDRIDTELLLRVHGKYTPDHLSFRFHHLEAEAEVVRSEFAMYTQQQLSINAIARQIHSGPPQLPLPPPGNKLRWSGV